MKKRFNISFLVYSLVLGCQLFSYKVRSQAQDSFPQMDIPLSIEEQSLFDFAAVRLETENYPSPPADILQQKFIPVKTVYSKDQLHFPDSIKSCWIKFVLHNRQSNDTTIALVFPGAVSKAVVYRSEKGSLIRIGKTGFFLAVTARNVEYQDNRIDLKAKAGSVSVYLIQVILYHGVWMGKMPVLQNYTYAETIAFRFEKQINRRNLMWLHFFTGIFFMFLYSDLSNSWFLIKTRPTCTMR